MALSKPYAVEQRSLSRCSGTGIHSPSLLIRRTLGQSISAHELIFEPLLAQMLSENLYLFILKNAFSLFRLVKFICGSDKKFLVESPFS